VSAVQTVSVSSKLPQHFAPTMKRTCAKAGL
jgi:hypothetical protein